MGGRSCPPWVKLGPGRIQLKDGSYSIEWVDEIPPIQLWHRERFLRSYGSLEAAKAVGEQLWLDRYDLGLEP